MKSPNHLEVMRTLNELQARIDTLENYLIELSALVPRKQRFDEVLERDMPDWYKKIKGPR